MQIPKDPTTGGLSRGDIREQSRRVFEGLKESMREAGGSLRDVTLVQVFLISAADWSAMNEVWAEYFTEAPFPERATIVAKELARPEMLIEIVAFAYVEAA
ncbi:RidA family protein [Steroidobacter sp.]|uniref:RidA family protein n=1 Tax=Steroidobacter sp. TaxID=1978227 RepID=UPI002EDAC07F